MAAALITILPKRLYDFTNLSVSQTQNYTVVERIDISQFVDGVIILRVHSCTVTSGTITFAVYGDGFTAEDPSVKFTTAASLISTQLVSGVVAPVLQTQGVTGTLLGRYALFRISGNRTSGTLKAEVSADLLLRSPDMSTPMAFR